MSQFRTTADILDEILQKSGEPTNGNSPYETLALTFANKVHHAIISGGNVFSVDVDEPWTWARARHPIVLELEAPFTTGSIAVLQSHTDLSFSTAPTDSLEGWFIQAQGKQTVYRITQHTEGALSATLDSNWVDSSGAFSFRAFKIEYEIMPAFMYVDSFSDRIEFQETSSATLTASLTHGSYAPSDYITHVAAQIDTVGANAYSGTYDSVQRKFLISRTSTPAGTYFNLLGISGAQAVRSALPTIGFDRIDYTGNQTYTTAYTPNGVSRLIEPFRVFKSTGSCTHIEATDSYNMELDYPLNMISQRTPDHFAKIAETNAGIYTVRFNAYPGVRTKVLIDWIPSPIDLQDNAVSRPLIPRKDIDVLINGAVTYILFDKSDTKAADTKAMTSTQLQAMQKKNRSELFRTGHMFAQIAPRLDLEYERKRLDYGYAAVGSASGQVTETPVLDFVYDQVSDTLVYQGWAANGAAQTSASWRIKRIVISLTDTVTVTYADGDTNFNNIWSNRAALVYS